MYRSITAVSPQYHRSITAVSSNRLPVHFLSCLLMLIALQKDLTYACIIVSFISITYKFLYHIDSIWNSVSTYQVN